MTKKSGIYFAGHQQQSWRCSSRETNQIKMFKQELFFYGTSNKSIKFPEIFLSDAGTTDSLTDYWTRYEGLYPPKSGSGVWTFWTKRAGIWETLINYYIPIHPRFPSLKARFPSWKKWSGIAMIPALSWLLISISLRSVGAIDPNQDVPAKSELNGYRAHQVR